MSQDLWRDFSFFVSIYLLKSARFPKFSKRGRGGNFYPVGSPLAIPSGHFPHSFFFPPRLSGKVFCSAARSAAIKIQSPDFLQKVRILSKKHRSERSERG
jgi:hypothetical protein